MRRTGLSSTSTPRWTPADGGLPRGHARRGDQLPAGRRERGGHPRRSPSGAYVVLDEVHHAGEDQAWGESLREAFAGVGAAPVAVGHAVPLRHPGHPVRALRGGRGGPRLRVRLRRRAARRARGAARLLPADGRPDGVERPGRRPVHEATFDDPLREPRSPTSACAPPCRSTGSGCPRCCARRSTAWRRCAAPSRTPAAWSSPSTRTMPAASPSCSRARFRRQRRSWSPPTTRRRPPDRARSRRGRDEWLVAVRMVSEGVDIPRLRVGRVRDRHDHRPVLPAGGRAVRALGPGRPRPAGVAVHPRRPAAAARAPPRSPSQRRHSLRRDARPGRASEDGRRGAPTRPFDRGAEQLSMFEALSATPTAGSAGWQPWLEELLPDDWDEDADATIEVDLAPPPPPRARRCPSPVRHDPTPGQGRTAARERRRRAGHRAACTGLSHATINGRLNRAVGIRSIDGATAEQLEARLRAADRLVRARVCAAEARSASAGRSSPGRSRPWA